MQFKGERSNLLSNSIEVNETAFENPIKIISAMPKKKITQALQEFKPLLVADLEPSPEVMKAYQYSQEQQISSEPVDIEAALAQDYLKIEPLKVGPITYLKGRKRPPAIKINAIFPKATTEPASPMTNEKFSINMRIPTAESKLINKPALRVIDEQITYDRLAQEIKKETGMLENIVL